MTKSKGNPKIDAFLKTAEKWREEMTKLRGILLGFPLTEELKWSKPCYSFQDSNVALIIPFKESCALMFCKGVLLKDAKKILGRPGENTQSGRWVKFTSVPEIVRTQATLKAYIKEAIEVEKSGLQVKYKKPAQFKIPVELKNKMNEMPALKKAFAALTPGRQRAYLMFFSAAKQSKTRESRIEKWTPQILKGRGWNER